jgi:hypothetical protein
MALGRGEAGRGRGDALFLLTTEFPCGRRAAPPGAIQRDCLGPQPDVIFHPGEAVHDQDRLASQDRRAAMTALTGGQHIARAMRDGAGRAKPSVRAGLGLGGIQVAALSATWYFYGCFTFLVTVLLTRVLVKALL